MKEFYFLVKMLFFMFFITEHFENRIFADNNSTYSEKRDSVIKSGIWSFDLLTELFENLLC